jgi:hypothetical protein
MDRNRRRAMDDSVVNGEQQTMSPAMRRIFALPGRHSVNNWD